QVLLFEYGTNNSAYTNLITKVVNLRTLRTNLLGYSYSAHLTNIVDSGDLSSGFTWWGEWITNMVTPLGTTVFEVGGTDMLTNTFCSLRTSANRWTKVTLPNGGKHLYLFVQDCSSFLDSTNWLPPAVSGSFPYATLDTTNQNF